MPVKSKDTRAAVYLTAEGVLPPAYVYMVSQKTGLLCLTVQIFKTHGQFA